ncbi:hypothetical protein CALCODRAFT_372538 [Calocera cornea HHB12733]|uniref:Uncharacterized protein n=1 Tax=Calocera cornea HHB12733 TaxID=1353952 RepID=A0A165EGZ5_9BASI|nr:hypothetical protein CALCODRAFT_372538 [Calocera cornea HHB12733]
MAIGPFGVAVSWLYLAIGIDRSPRVIQVPPIRQLFGASTGHDGYVGEEVGYLRGRSSGTDVEHVQVSVLSCRVVGLHVSDTADVGNTLDLCRTIDLYLATSDSLYSSEYVLFSVSGAHGNLSEMIGC